MEFDDGLKTNGSIKLSSNSVTDRMVEAAQAWMRKQAGYLTLTDEFVRGLIEAALREQPAPEPVAWGTALASAWSKLESEKVVKLTRQAQPEYGYTVPLYAHPPESHSEAYCQSETIRMQDKELNELRAAAQMALENLDVISDWLQNTGNDHLCDEYAATLDAIDALRAALEGQTTPDKLIEQAEPVTWDWLPSDARDKWVIGAPQRKPLTEEEIVKLDEPVADVPWERVLKFVRRIERAHGIGGEE